ncbi:hypothetical protein VARIO8X_50013 [Burkholderiales bacterium 8X]|nr:hypothetical protein VARIO8X_50013 [Burkholderiales bacterium 8X]
MLGPPGTRYGPVDPTARDPVASLGATCGARVSRGPHELASLKQHGALIRETLRSSARAEGSPSPHRVPGYFG